MDRPGWDPREPNSALSRGGVDPRRREGRKAGTRNLRAGQAEVGRGGLGPCGGRSSRVSEKGLPPPSAFPGADLAPPRPHLAPPRVSHAQAPSAREARGPFKTPGARLAPAAAGPWPRSYWRRS